ncbi:MAG: serine/threonine-protein kinase [Pseudomonadota bacterium]
MAEQAPTAIGKYQILSTVGEGAMGVVYRGHDPDIDRVVAIKTIHGHLMGEAERAGWLERFAREAKAAGRCMHPNLVTVFDYLEQECRPYLVMEYLDAETLGDRMARGLPSFPEIGSIMRQMLAGLSAVHAEGIVHRDVKPANVMLLPDGRVKVADFGVARVESLGATYGGMIGTPSYMAPEQFLGQPMDERGDVFAAGVILYELISGRKPFDGASMAALCRSVVAGEWRRLTELEPTMPPALDALLERALAPEANDRFANAMAFSEALEAAFAAASPDATADTLASAATVIAPPQARPPMGAETSMAPGTVGSQDGDRAPRGLSQTLLDEIPASVFGKIEGQLIQQFGPIGKIWVRKAAASTNDIERMIDLLAEHVGDREDAARFRAELREQLRQGSGAGIRKEYMTELTKALSPYLGPIAAVLVKRTARQVRSEAELTQTLAQEIQDERDRQAFLSRVV